MKIFTKILFSVLSFCFAFQLNVAAATAMEPEDFQASMLPSGWDDVVDNAAKSKTSSQTLDFVGSDGDQSSNNEKGLDYIQKLFFDNFVIYFRYLVVGIVLIYIMIDVIDLIINGSEEETVTKFKGNLGYYALGLILISVSSEIVKILDPAALSNDDIGNVEQVKSFTQLFINYLALFVGAIATFFMVIAAVRMITAQGDEAVIDEEKKDFKFGLVGLIVVLMADVVINRVFYPVQGNVPIVPGNEQQATFAQEVMGLAEFFLAALAMIALFGLILAAGYYIMSFGDDDQLSRAGRIVKNLAIGFVMIGFAYTFVSTVTPDATGAVVPESDLTYEEYESKRLSFV